MSVREIDPADADAQRIDKVMLGWRRQQGSAFEEDLRRRLGGPSMPPDDEELPPIEPTIEPPAREPKVLEAQPIESTPPADAPKRVELQPMTAERPTPLPTLSTAEPRAVPVRHAAKRRNNKQWKKPKARRR